MASKKSVIVSPALLFPLMVTQLCVGPACNRYRKKPLQNVSGCVRDFPFQHIAMCIAVYCSALHTLLKKSVMTAEYDYDWSDWKIFSFAKMMLPPFLWHHFAASHSSIKSKVYLTTQDGAVETNPFKRRRGRHRRSAQGKWCLGKTLGLA